MSASINPQSGPPGWDGGTEATGDLQGVAVGEGEAQPGAPVTHPAGGLVTGGVVAAGGPEAGGGAVAGGRLAGGEVG
ncbi:MAG: hypothetical protein NVS9B11_23650 [Candidatus Dormibacteraceae bacterium]